MINNGFVIQNLNKTKYKIYLSTKYRGIGRYMSWPLDDCYDNNAKLLSKNLWDNWFGYLPLPLMVVPDYNFIDTYMKICERNNINVRILLVQSDYNKILTNSVNYRVKEELGYEIVSLELGYSPCYDEIYLDKIPELSNFYKYINKQGLFSSEQHAKQYLEIRNNLINNGSMLELLEEPICVKLSEVLINDL